MKIKKSKSNIYFSIKVLKNLKKEVCLKEILFMT
jgi:hypothetical protein